MKTKNKNLVLGLLAIRADFYKDTFGKHVSWESVNRGTKDDPDWQIDIYEDQDTGYSFNYEHIAMIAQVSMASHWLSVKEIKGRNIVRFHLY